MVSERVVFIRDTIVVNNHLRIRLHRLCGGKVAGRERRPCRQRSFHQPEDYVLRLGPVVGGDRATGCQHHACGRKMLRRSTRT